MNSPAALPSAADAGPRWRSPSAALAQFTAPAHSLVAVDSSLSREFARYGFRVGGLNLLIARGTDAKLVEARGIAPIPHTPAWLIGMKNLAGHPTPVFDLRAALGLPAGEAPAAPMVLVLGKGDDALGLQIDGHTTALRGLASAQGAATAVPERLAPYSSTAWVGNGTVWLEFDHQRFFAALREAAR
jgi:chemotaxis signal transduction protein